MKKTIKRAYKPKKKPIRWLVQKLREEQNERVYIDSVYRYDTTDCYIGVMFRLLALWWLNWIVEWVTDREMSRKFERVKNIKKEKENV